MTLLPVHSCPNDPPAAQLSGGAPPCSDQCSLASVGAMLSNEDITTVPPSEENQLRTPRPLWSQELDVKTGERWRELAKVRGGGNGDVLTSTRVRLVIGM